jgi:hypothetical protein
MAKVSFDFDNEGYINVRGEKYSALEIVNDAGDTALDWMLASDNAELVGLASTWGLTPDKDDRTGSVEEKPTDDPENEGNVDDAVDKSDTGSGGLSNEEITSLTDKLNILFGYKVVKGVVQKDPKTGKPVISNQKAAIKITGGVEPKIQADGTIDIPGDVTINLVSGDKSLPSVKDGKFTIKFGTIGGNFICRGVKLSSLEGGPKKVTGQFDISKNELTSLVGSPEEVGSFFATDNKKLTSLTGGPKIIKGITDTNKNQKEFIYDVSGCALTTLEGNGITSFGPGGFNCGGNKITSLAGLGVVTSTGVTRFDCSNNQLTSLNGIPRPIKDAKTGRPGNYWISNNIQITVFPVNMADFEVDGFVASGLSLTSLSFAPKQIYGDFDCTNNKGSKKLTNQSIGKDRFKVGGGFEDDAGNRIVKIDGEFITSEGSWKDKTYDVNTTFKKSETQTQSGSAGQAPLGSGSIGGVEYIENPTKKLSSGKPSRLWLQKFNPSNLRAGYTAPKAVGKNQIGENKYPFGSKNTDGWVAAGFKNFINAGPFEGSSNPTWGSGQPNGLFIVDGKNYGSKLAEAKNLNSNNSDMRFLPMVVVKPTPDIISNGYATEVKPGSTDGIIKKGWGNIQVGIPMYNICIKNNAVKDVHASFKNYSGFPFIGILGSGMWFAGATDMDGPRTISTSWNIPEISTAVLNHFNKKDDTVKIMSGGDGGGSTKLVVNGRLVGGSLAENRAVPTILAW